MKRYVWAEHGSCGVDPNEAARVLARIAKRGEVTPDRVVDAARPDGSPLHSAFEWDDAVAAELHRHEQARHMLRHIRVVKGDGADPERVFFHIETEDLDAYVYTARVMTERQLYESLLEDAMIALRAARKRYAEVYELAPVWAVVDEIAS